MFQGAKNVPYSSLELRTESLNVVATNSYSKKPIAVTGGQAGLLFIRPCRLDIGGNTVCLVLIHNSLYGGPRRIGTYVFPQSVCNHNIRIVWLIIDKLLEVYY